MEIKQLDWIYNKSDCCWISTIGWGMGYTILFDKEKKMFAMSILYQHSVIGGADENFKTLEEAKKSAQSHFEDYVGQFLVQDVEKKQTAGETKN